MLFSSVFAAMFGSFVKYQFQRTYDAILAAPVDTEELVTAEALWIAARAGVFGCAPLLVAMVFGLDPSWGMLLVPFIGALTGYGWACFGIFIAAMLNSIDHFSLRHEHGDHADVPHRRHVLPDLRPARVGAGARPVQPALPLRAARAPRRASASRAGSTSTTWARLIVFAIVTWRLAIHYMAKKLVD